jgi:O-acetyl-ADP-ribose deacetylase (regulator of RNase III)
MKIYKGDAIKIRADAIINPANACFINGSGLTGTIFGNSCADLKKKPLSEACWEASDIKNTGSDNVTVYKIYDKIHGKEHSVTTNEDTIRYQEALSLYRGAVGRGCYITPAFRLPSKYIIHVAGPDTRITIQSLFKEELLKQTYLQCLTAANSHPDIYTVVFCSISTGIFEYPIKEASKTAMSVVREFLKENAKLICLFCVFDDNALSAYNESAKSI